MLSYLPTCEELQIAPLPLICRPPVDGHIDLPNYGIGDAYGTALAKALSKEDGLVTSICLRNNALHVSSLGSILAALRERFSGSLRSVDISMNAAGPTLLPHALSLQAHCPELRSLSLQGCKLGDRAVSRLCAALETHGSMEELHLGSNDVNVDGARAIARLLQNMCGLRLLDLSWNSITGIGGAAIAQAMAVNRTLRQLGLAWNRLGRSEADVALLLNVQSHPCLQVLDLAYNGCEEDCAVAAAQLLRRNDRLQALTLDGNPLGVGGGKLMMRALVRAGPDRQISMAACNFSVIYPSSLYNVDRPAGHYRLDLRKPFHRIVAMELLDLSVRHGSSLRAPELDGKPVMLNGAGGPTEEKVVKGEKGREREEEVVEEKEEGEEGKASMKEVDPPVIAIEPAPSPPVASAAAAAAVTAVTATAAGSELVSETPSPTPLRPESTASEYIALAAVAEDGSSEGEGEGKGASSRTSALLAPPSAASAATGAAAGTAGASSGRRRSTSSWELPATGILEFDFVGGGDAPKPEGMDEERFAKVKALLLGRASTPEEMEVARRRRVMRSTVGQFRRAGETRQRRPVLRREDSMVEEHPLSVFELVAKENRFLVSQALTIMSIVRAKKLFSTWRGEVQFLVDLYTQVSDSHRGAELLKTVALRDRKRAIHALGAFYAFNHNNPTGHYRLLLSRHMDRLVAQRLIELATADRVARQSSGKMDISQKGNFQPLRNETMNGVAFTFGPTWVLPDSGWLEFDYVATTRPAALKTGLGDEDKLAALLKEVQAVTEEDLVIAGVESEEDARLARLRRLSFPIYLSAEEAVTVLQAFPAGRKREEAFVILFTRVVDEENMDALLKCCGDGSRQALRRRIGYLHLFNPMLPERSYKLDLSLYEEREVARVLVELACAEPGQNWRNELFDGRPFDLTTAWVSKIPTAGVLELEYVAYKNGIRWDVRRRLARQLLGWEFHPATLIRRSSRLLSTAKAMAEFSALVGRESL
eukprot:PLAT3273.4.p1 GENE.PLAT3273.4~~PLAT3273.4.p1  ORF type:complete len:991 (+),score=433.08 PLAT3273.4:1-2973(+)